MSVVELNVGERPNHDTPQVWDPSLVSASRVNSYLSCGVAFEKHYIQGIPAKRSGSAALFGNVLHKALETWALDRTQSLVTLTAQAWKLEVARSPIVLEFIEKYQGMSVSVMQAEADAIKKWEADPRNRGKTSKAPRMTKYFKESPAAKKLGILLAEYIPKLNAGSHWRFTDRDPLPNLYDESLKVAKRYSLANRERPNAIHTEFGFKVAWHGHVLRGYIDNIEPTLVDGELVGYEIVDYKTYVNDPPKAKDWRQGVMYHVSIRDLVDRGVLPLDPSLPTRIVFDYVRLGKRRDYLFGAADELQLLVELDMYRKGVDAGVFLTDVVGAEVEGA